MKKNSGFSLIEIMFCIFFGSLIILDLMQQYSNVYRQNKILEKRLLQSLDLQLVSELIRNSLREAGFTPCGNLDKLEKVGDSDLETIQISTNAIEITRMGSDYHEFSSINDAMQFLDKFSPNKKYLLTDCYHVALFENDFKDKGFEYIQNNYVSPIYVGEFIHEKYWIKELNSLYYKFKHSERVTDNIKGILANLLDDDYVQVKLILMNDSVYELLVRIRSR